MKIRLFFIALTLWLILPAGAVYAQAVPKKPAQNTVAQKLPWCDEALTATAKINQAQADLECRTVMQCVECVDRATKQETCKTLVVQPEVQRCDRVGRVSQEPAGNTPVAEPFRVEIIQTACYFNGVNLEALVVDDGRHKPDPQVVARYIYAWELDGRQLEVSGNRISCIEGKTVKVKITKRSTKESVTRLIQLPEGQTDAIDPTKNLVARYRKTGCFGPCPIFEVEVFDNGLVTWNGIMNTGTPGKAEKDMGPDFVQRLERQITTANFFALNDRYPDYYIWDAATTVTLVSLNGRKKEVVHVFDGPRSLKDLEKFFDDMIAQNGWKAAAPVSQQGKTLNPTPVKD
jgi:hypothetical protein